MRKEIVFAVIVLLAVVLGSCGNWAHRWDAKLVSEGTQGGEEITIRGMYFKDEFIEVVFTVGQSEIAFDLGNRTEKGIKIDWTASAFITPQNESLRVVHKGTRYVKRFETQAPTTIPPKSKIHDLLIPSDYIHWATEEKGDELQRGDLFPGWPKEPYYGKVFKLYLPMKIGERLVEYIFLFKIIQMIWL